MTERSGRSVTLADLSAGLDRQLHLHDLHRALSAASANAGPADGPEGPADVRLVSFTVDPETTGRGAAPVRRTVRRRRRPLAVPHRDRAAMYRLIREGFRLAVDGGNHDSARRGVLHRCVLRWWMEGTGARDL